MPSEVTPEYVKDLYEHASAILKGQDYVYAIPLLERLAQLNDPFYTPFTLALLVHSYVKIGREDLEKQTILRVTKLPKDQQVLLNPRWLAACYLKSGELQASSNILVEALKLMPNDPTLTSALAEVYLLQGKFNEALPVIEQFRERPEPKFQALGRMMRGILFALTQKEEEAEKEFEWVGQFLITNGALPPDTWDYRDMKPLVAKLGSNAQTARLLTNVLNANMTVQEFANEWTKITAATEKRGTG